LVVVGGGFAWDRPGLSARAAVVALAAMAVAACTQSAPVSDQGSDASASSSSFPDFYFAEATYAPFPEAYFAPATYASRGRPPSLAMSYAAAGDGSPATGMRLASASSTPLLLSPVKHAFDPSKTSYGVASFYRHDTATASGERFDERKLTAAHKTLPFGTKVRVTSLKTGRSVTVRINDRGPFVEGRIVDLSYAAAEELDIVDRGITRVRLEVVEEPPATRTAAARASVVAVAR
jgi:rare lipoprotein A